jgi:hypothetical protein
MRILKLRAALVFVLVSIALAIGACSSVQLVSNYDETIDNEARALQKKLDSYFISLQNADSESLKYKNHQKFYESVLADLNAIEIRAGGIYKNELTIEQLELAKENLTYLVLLHKGCITAPLSIEQKKKIAENGIDLSMDCKMQNGATADATDQGEVGINRLILGPVQRLFNQHLGAIMALELAKKRGETKMTEE